MTGFGSLCCIMKKIRRSRTTTKNLLTQVMAFLTSSVKKILTFDLLFISYFILWKTVIFLSFR